MATCNICKYAGTPTYKSPCSECKGYSKYEYEKPKTNADRIRAMSNMGIAKLFTQAVANGCPPNMDWDCKKDDGGWEACDKCWCKWLQQPAEVCE